VSLETIIVEGMAVEANLRSNALQKSLYKIELYIIKVIPYILALFYLLNTILSYFYIDIPLISYIAGISLLPLLFLYITSFVFNFCTYHRLPIYYIFVNWLIVVLDYYFDFTKYYETTVLISLITAGITILSIVYLKFKNNG
jgi:hypothetical protein